MSSCLINGYGESPPPDFYVKNELVARTKYTCCECYKRIMPKDNYLEERGQWDGIFQTVRTCADCLSIRYALFNDYWHGDLWDDLENYIFNGGLIPKSALVTLTPNAKFKVLSMIQEYLESLED